MSRDDQFAGFAHSLLVELKPDLTMLFTELNMNYPSRSDTGIEHAEEIIEKHIAQRAYDLVRASLRSIVGNDSREWSPEYLGSLSMYEEDEIRKYLDALLTGIPDMAALPKESEDAH